VFKNEGGFTLIEFLVAIVILMVGMLALLQSVNLAIEHNLKSQIRNEATVLGDEQMHLELSKPFDLIQTSTSSATVQRNILKGFRNFSVVRTGASFSNSKQVNFTISWRDKNIRQVHETSSVVSKTNQ